MSESAISHRVSDVVSLFDGLFSDTYRTRLVRGDEEPLYLPAGSTHDYHRIVFAHGFFASALHEVSHWCIAGVRRRTLEDYGYWYLPDGRDAEQQKAFEAAEIAPQALEMLFAEACGRRFQVSVDNLNGVSVDRHAFQVQVKARAQRYLADGLPRRAEAFRRALYAFYQQGATPLGAIAAGRTHLFAISSSEIVGA